MHVRSALIMNLFCICFSKELCSFFLINCMQEDTCSDPTEHILKILVVHGADREDPVDVSILLEGREMFPGCGSTAKACTLLMGLI